MTHRTLVPVSSLAAGTTWRMGAGLQPQGHGKPYQGTAGRVLGRGKNGGVMVEVLGGPARRRSDEWSGAVRVEVVE